MYNAYTSAAARITPMPTGLIDAADGAPTIAAMPPSDNSRASTRTRSSGSMPRAADISATHAG